MPDSTYPFADRDLARRLERAEGVANADFVEARARAFPDLGATWVEIAGAYAMFDGIGSPVTQTFGLGLFEEAGDDALAALERFFLERGADVFHEVSPLHDPSLLERLLLRGYRPVELSNVLFRPIPAARGASPGPFHVREVSAGEHDLWARVAAAGWRDVAPDLDGYLRELGRVNAERRTSASFLVEHDDAEGPIAAGVLSLAGDVAQLAGACTLPAWRRRGAQNALFEHRMRHARERGAKLAMMSALPGSSSQKNAERQGFRVAYTRIKWGRTGGAEPAANPAAEAGGA